MAQMETVTTIQALPPLLLHRPQHSSPLIHHPLQTLPLRPNSPRRATIATTLAAGQVSVSVEPFPLLFLLVELVEVVVELFLGAVVVLLVVLLVDLLADLRVELLEVLEVLGSRCSSLVRPRLRFRDSLGLLWLVPWLWFWGV
jgi:hypothetical protein